jgi:HAD superfamily hydrolase (TIGR01509 family)
MRAVCFDWDGTLVDTISHMYAATKLVMAEIGVDLSFDTYRLHFTPDWKQLYRRLDVPDAAVESMGARWWSIYDGQDQADLLPGAAAALRRLADAGIAIGLVTGGYRFNVEPQLERHGVADLFPVRVYGDDIPFAKPHPEPLLTALRGLGVSDAPAETAYVGDALDDIRMAVAVGARPVGITSILGDETELRSAGAVDVAASVADWVDALLCAPGVDLARRV